AGLRSSLRADVRVLLREQQVAAVLVTHDQAEALAIADRVAVMLDGRLAQAGTPEEVYRTPASIAVGEFVGEAIVLDAEAEGDHAHTAVGKVQLIAPGRGTGRILVRPEQIAVEPALDDSPFTIRDIAFGGAHSEVRVDGPGAAIRSLRGSVDDLRAGDAVSVRVCAPVPFYAG
ncbi:TOBE domain-containing protein, partial [Rhodococcus zopfii]